MRRARSPARRLASTRGFTLFEAVVAVALTGLVLAVLATVTAQWLPNWRTGFARAQRTDLLGLGLDRIVADLSAAEFISLGGAVDKPLFEGSPTSVVFVRSALGPNRPAGLEIVRLANDENGLVRARAAFTPTAGVAADAGQFEFSDAIIVVREPLRISFAFAGRDRAWRETWSDAKLLPAAIRVTVRNSATDEILAASTATNLHVNAPAECVRANSPYGCIDQLERSTNPSGPGK